MPILVNTLREVTSMPLIPLLKRLFGRKKALPLSPPVEPPSLPPPDWLGLKQRAVNGDAQAIRQLIGFLPPLTGKSS